MISILKETLSSYSLKDKKWTELPTVEKGKAGTPDALSESEGLLNSLISTLEDIAQAEDLDKAVATKITLETIPKVQWIKQQLPELDRLGWSRNESYKLRSKIREIEIALRRDLYSIQKALSAFSAPLRKLTDTAIDLSTKAAFSYIKLGRESK